MASKFKKLVASGFVIGAVAMATEPSYAGGLFGDGGIIRGDVGKFLDRNLEKPILTPVARTTVVFGGAAIGAAVGGKAGAVVGAGIGQAINEAVGPGKSSGQQVAVVETGQTCSTTMIGNWPLTNPLPLGTECFVKLQNGSQVAGKTIK